MIIGRRSIDVSMLDFNSYKGEIQEQAKKATGRDLLIAGDIDLKLSMTPCLTVAVVHFQNAEWGLEPDMASVGAGPGVNLTPFLSSTVEALRGVTGLLETNQARKGNADMASAHKSEVGKDGDTEDNSKGDDIPRIGEVTLANIQVTYRDGAKGAENNLVIETIALKQNAAGSLDTRIKLVVDGQTADVTGGLPAIADIVKSGATLPTSLKGPVFDFAIEVAAEFMVHHDKAGPNKVDVADLKAKIEGSDVPGSTSRIESNLLDLVALQAKACLSATASDEAAAAPPLVEAKHPLDQSLALEALKAIDPDIRATVKTLTLNDKLSVTDVSVVATLQNGLMTVQPPSTMLSGGKVDLAGTVDGRKPTAKIAIDQKWTSADFGALAKVFQSNDLIEAKGGTVVKISGAGKTPRQMLATLGGHTAVVVCEGKINNAYWELISADVATQFEPVVGKSERGELNCMVSRFDIKGGLATAKALLADSGQVTIELAGQEPDLKPSLRPKIPSLITGPATSPTALSDPLVDFNPLPLPFLIAGNAHEPCSLEMAVAEGWPVSKTARKAEPKSGGVSIVEKVTKPEEVDRGLFGSLKKVVY